MKYIITSTGDIRIGNTYHYDLAKNCSGKVIKAGHIKIKDAEVFGKSNTFNIKADESDLDLINNI